MSEPTPPTGEFVPDSVLDELKIAFEAESLPSVDDPFDPTVEIIDLTFDAPLPPRSTIVIGGDDELPDAVYLDDEELGSIATRLSGAETAGRNTIVIGDELDSTGAFDAVDVPSRSMDPRVRARRIAVKRAQGRRRLIWVFVGVGILLAAVAVLAVFASSLFAVKTVDVQGNVYTDPVQLQAVIDTMQGEPVLLVDTAAAERSLEAISWVEVAVVRRRFPDSVFIDIRERQPLATFQGSDGRYRVIDREGRVLDVLDGQPVDYMLLTGPAPDTEVGGFAGPPFAAAAQMVSALPPEIRNITQTASVDATTGDLGLVLNGTPADASAGTEATSIEVRLGGYGQLDSKLARLLKLVRDGLDGIVRIDVSTDDVSVTKG
ncbi:MAG: putative cell division protein FtsQ [Actinomycetota bacterium]